MPSHGWRAKWCAKLMLCRARQGMPSCTEPGKACRAVPSQARHAELCSAAVISYNSNVWEEYYTVCLTISFIRNFSRESSTNMCVTFVRWHLINVTLDFSLDLQIYKIKMPVNYAMTMMYQRCNDTAHIDLTVSVKWVKRLIKARQGARWYWKALISL